MTVSTRSTFRLVVRGVAALGVVALTPGVAFSAPPEDACALASRAQVGAAVGVPVKAGEYVTPTFKKTCTWNRAGGASGGVKFVTISFTAADSFEKGKTLASLAAARDRGKMAVTSVGGIGDDAYFASMGTGYTTLMVKKGNVALKIAIYGDVPREKASAMAKALAAVVLPKF